MMKRLTCVFCALLLSGSAAAIDLNGLRSIGPVAETRARIDLCIISMAPTPEIANEPPEQDPCGSLFNPFYPGA